MRATSRAAEHHADKAALSPPGCLLPSVLASAREPKPATGSSADSPAINSMMHLGLAMKNVLESAPHASSVGETLEAAQQ